MIRCDEDERVAVGLGERERCLHSLIEVDRLADLTAGVGRVVALVDARAFDLQEEPLAFALAARVEQQLIAFCVSDFSESALGEAGRGSRSRSSAVLAPPTVAVVELKRVGKLPDVNRPRSGFDWSAAVTACRPAASVTT